MESGKCIYEYYPFLVFFVSGFKLPSLHPPVQLGNILAAFVVHPLASLGFQLACAGAISQFLQPLSFNSALSTNIDPNSALDLLVGWPCFHING